MYDKFAHFFCSGGFLSVHQKYSKLEMRSVERGICGLPHSHVHNERTVPIIMVDALRISTSGEKSDVTIVFCGPDFIYDANISAIRIHLRQI